METVVTNETKLVYPYSLSELGYSYDALEPYIDKATMEIHYSKHHAAYIANLNNAIKGTDAEKLPLSEIISNISKYPVAVRNNGGGHYNHSLFWKMLSPKSSGAPKGKLADALNSTFGSIEKFKEEFESAAKTRFGSGWAWLSVDSNGKLFVSSTPNQDNPLMDVVDKKGTPVLCLDVWEHAYYLKYQNRRPDYVSAFWSVVNWAEVERRYEDLL
ncbi:MAG: superoxide dismutase [Bacteroidia bacterium]|nr:superoxide dismutase [Bacteroidia bacterium]